MRAEGERERGDREEREREDHWDEERERRDRRDARERDSAGVEREIRKERERMWCRLPNGLNRLLLDTKAGAVKDKSRCDPESFELDATPFGKQHVKNLELILLDEHNTMMQATVRMALVNHTKVEPCPDFSGSFYGFNFRGYIFITDLQQEEDGQFYVIGHVITCEDLDM
ncbi:hypothetical protein Tco_1133639 [Tanacetum coccineum]